MLQIRRSLAFTFIWTQFALLSALPGYAQGPGDAANARRSTAELHQLVAPIALYPDSLAGTDLGGLKLPDSDNEAQRWFQKQCGTVGHPVGSSSERTAVGSRPQSADGVPKLSPNPKVVGWRGKSTTRLLFLRS
jgi:hypothetical protein